MRIFTTSKINMTPIKMHVLFKHEIKAKFIILLHSQSHACLFLKFKTLIKLLHCWVAGSH